MKKHKGKSFKHVDGKKLFAFSSLTITLMGASTGISALTLDQDTKTVTVDTPYTMDVVYGPDKDYLNRTIKHGRLFSNVTLAGHDGADTSPTPAASATEASGYTLNIQNQLDCPTNVTESKCPVGAARIEHDSISDATTNNNKTNLSASAILNAENSFKGQELFAGYIRMRDKTEASEINANILQDGNVLTIEEGSVARNMGGATAALAYTGVSGSATPSGSINATLTNNQLIVNGGDFTLSNGALRGAQGSINGKSGINVNLKAENNSVVINNITENAQLWLSREGGTKSVSGIYGAELSSNTGTTGTTTIEGIGNSVTIENGTFNTLSDSIVGARFSSESKNSELIAKNNAVTINGGTFIDLPYIQGANSGYLGTIGSTLTGNKVTINGGEFVAKGVTSSTGETLMAPVSTLATGVFVTSYTPTQKGTVNASQNEVVISGGNGNSLYAFGALVQGAATEHAINENVVTLSGGEWGKMPLLIGGASYYGQDIITGNRNKVNITGGTVNNPIANVFGFYAPDIGTPTGETQAINAEGNEILVSANVPISFISGAFVNGDDLSKSNIKLINNKITLSNAPVLDNANLYGAVVPAAKIATAASADVFTGNTLVLDNYTGTSKLSTVANFENYQFVLPANHVVNQSVALKTATLSLDSLTDANKHAVVQSVAFLGEPRALNVGDKIYLIDADTINGTLGNKDQTLMVQQGVTLETETIVKQEPNKIYLLVDKLIGAEEPQPPVIPEPEPEPEPEEQPDDTTPPVVDNTNEEPTSPEEQPSEPEVSQPIPEPTVPVVASHVKPEAKTFSEGYLAGALATIRASDLLVGQGITEAKLVKERFARWKGFAIASGIRGKYDTGSHIDTKDTSIIAGLVKGSHLDKGDLTIGAFFEAGRSRYDTFNDKEYGGNGNGTVDYAGGGVLARFDAHSGFYAETSIRAGNAKNKFNSGLVDGLGRVSSYKTSSSYFSFHVGAGHEWKINQKLDGEVYAKYLYSQLKGADVTTTTGDKLSFDEVNSQRFRVGGRLAYKATDRLTPYVGLAVEHEMSAKAKATTFGLGIPAPSLKGTSGMAEVGVKLLPSQSEYGWNADVNVRGYFGKRKEVGGTIRVGYRF